MARLTELEGAVTLTRGAEKRAAAQEDVFEGDLVATGPDGRAVLTFESGRALELGSDSAFRLGESKKVDLDFDEGVISIVQDARGPALLTPNGRTRVEPGTRARVETKKRSMAIEILTGGIVTLGTDGKQSTASAGQRMELDLGAVRIVDAPPKKKKVELVQLEVRMVMDKGAAELKEKGQKGFKASGGTDALAPGTEFKVNNSARARLATRGAELVLMPGASGTFLGAEQKEDQSELSVALKSGSTLVRFSGEQKAQVLVEGSGVPARLTASSEASVLVAHSPKGPRVQVLTGKVDVASSGGEAQNVGAGEAVTLSSSGPKVAAAGSGDVQVPLGRRVRVYTNAPLELGIALGDAPVKVEVAADAEFKQVLSSGEAKGTLLARPAGNELHWRTVDEKGQPVKVGSARFLPERVTAKSSDKGRNETVSETGQKATVVFQEDPPALTFEFPSNPAAKSYRLKVFKAGELTTPVATEEGKAPRITLASGALKEGNYVWYGAGLDATGGEKASGKMNKMEIVYDNSNATLAIHSPAPGPAGRDDTTASGVAPLGAKLFINDKPVQLDAKGRFSQEVGKVRPLVFRCVQQNGVEDFLLR